MNYNEIVGISFRLRGYDAHLRYLFEKIHVSDYTWYVSESENFISTKGKVVFFLPEGIYSGEKFADIVFSAKDYYIHLIRIFAAPPGLEFQPDKIDDFRDYLRSNAEIALLSADSFVDLYVKKPDILRNIVDSYERNTWRDKEPFEYITPQKDGRMVFHV